MDSVSSPGRSAAPLAFSSFQAPQHPPAISDHTPELGRVLRLRTALAALGRAASGWARAASLASASLLLPLVLAPGVARAEEPSGGGSERSPLAFGLNVTIGEGMYFIDSDVYRGPVSLEIMPALELEWFTIDFGLSTTLESIRIAETDVGNWNFTFRPGIRITPPMFPMYARIALPLELQTDDFDWGVLFGVGADIPLFGMLGLMIEVDTTLSNRLEWGGDGLPLEFRIGISLDF